MPVSIARCKARIESYLAVMVPNLYSKYVHTFRFASTLQTTIDTEPHDAYRVSEEPKRPLATCDIATCY